jgi:hypothetical protein
MSLDLSFNETSSNFNKPITVQAPANAQKIEDVVLPLLKTQKINADMKQIGSVAQSVFVTNNAYSSLCYRGLLNGYLNTYGNDLITLNNDIVSQGAVKPICLSGVQGYCVSTLLADGSYLCIDKNNTVGRTKCISAQTICQ